MSKEGPGITGMKGISPETRRWCEENLRVFERAVAKALEENKKFGLGDGHGQIRKRT